MKRVTSLLLRAVLTGLLLTSMFGSIALADQNGQGQNNNDQGGGAGRILDLPEDPGIQ